MIFRINDQIQVGVKYYQCICADERTAVFGPLIKKKDCLRTSYKGMVAYSNTEPSSYTRVIIKQWDGKSLKSFTPIKNAVRPSEKDNGVLTVFTKKGKIVFKPGQYIKQVNGEIYKP